VTADSKSASSTSRLTEPDAVRLFGLDRLGGEDQLLGLGRPDDRGSQ